MSDPPGGSSGELVGVEEEFFLVDAVSGALAPAIGDVVERLPEAVRPFIGPETLECQVEVRSPPCRSIGELLAAQQGLRRQLVEAAHAVGVAVIASGVPVWRDGSGSGDGGCPVLPDPRLSDIRNLMGAVMEPGVCGTHVHVSTGDLAEGLAVAGASGAWYSLLAAGMANSAVCWGRDHGFASWRSILISRWPVSGPPPQLTVPEYRSHVASRVRSGAILDNRMVYWDVRPSETFGTVEFRSADAQSCIRRLGGYAALCRASVRAFVSGDLEFTRALEWSSFADDRFLAARFGTYGRFLGPGGPEREPWEAAGERFVRLLLPFFNDDMEADLARRYFSKDCCLPGFIKQRQAMMEEASWRSVRSTVELEHACC